MSVRTDLLIKLRQELLGPRTSSEEILSSRLDPRNEFITGVLIPRSAEDSQVRDIGDEVETLGTGTDGPNDDDEQEDAPAAAPVLDPKSLPRSLGISFSIRSTIGTAPSLKVCATWARYQAEQVPEDVDSVFRRTPQCFVSEPIVICGGDSRLLGEVGQVKISLRSIQTSPNNDIFKISVYLVNETSLIDPANPTEQIRAKTEHLVFQPQIRIVLEKGTELVPFDTFQPQPGTPSPGSLEEEDESLALIYQRYQSYARGHLCGAVWREVDPERSLDDGDASALSWDDKTIVVEQYGNQVAQSFACSDCRTEYLPCYSVQSPAIGWRDGLTATEPNLNASNLAETWDSEAMRASLHPLVEGYETWITRQEQQISQLDTRYHRAAQRHMESCRHAALRMSEAIALIAQDEDARLAFCFANKAIYLQALWKKPVGERSTFQFRWRPFQLAFILLNIAAIVNPAHEDRLTCDLLAFPTGGGKTEAYLGLAAFTLGLRRLRSPQDAHGHRTGHGVGVISRYTLRLLTIQQFRRALGLTVACEVLRVQNSGTGISPGWRPQQCSVSDQYIWGTSRFSAGLWVGGGVTPNALEGNKYFNIVGAFDALKGDKSEGEPAQVLNCPCCGSVVAVPKDGLGPGLHTLHLMLRSDSAITPSYDQNRLPGELDGPPNLTLISNNHAVGYITLSMRFQVADESYLSIKKLDDWWENGIQPQLSGATLVPFRVTRPGYFQRSYQNNRGNEKPVNFEVFCPAPDCDLNVNKRWQEKVPLPLNQCVTGQLTGSDFFAWETPLEPFQVGSNYASRIPISAFTVDDQIYSRIPSLLVATVDKFARLAFEPRAGAIFGNVSHYHSRGGYYRNSAEKDHNHPPPRNQWKAVDGLQPPDLILQDELHLIEGPLGSMVGLYETAVDTLCEQTQGTNIIRPKYIASTATVRQSQSQILCLFDRKVFQFPPPALSATDSFFALTPANVHPVETDANDQHPSGRLYVAVCAPGKGAQTPLVRIYSSLLQGIQDLRQQGRSDEDCDPYWTMVGYFNAIRELAGALTLYRQDIPERINHNAGITGVLSRDLEEAIELSSRQDSTELPGLLSSLARPLPDPGTRDIVLSTSMFGTGVDIDRLGLMVVNGQPKTTASYIQATGRVGRRQGGLVVTFLRASRPRDLDHYEFFTGYHRALYRYVEPITVTPFAARSRERGMGPVAVALLRQGRTIAGVNLPPSWAADADARQMQVSRQAAEVQATTEIINQRSQAQVPTRRPPLDQVDREVRGGLDRWQSAATQESTLTYVEYAIKVQPTRPVVLGDEQHQQQGWTTVYRNSPQSLRDVESMTRFGRVRDNQQNQGGQGNGN